MSSGMAEREAGVGVGVGGQESGCGPKWGQEPGCGLKWGPQIELGSGGTRDTETRCRSQGRGTMHGSAV